MRDWLSDEELNERGRTPCYHEYIRLNIRDNVDDIAPGYGPGCLGGPQMEHYRCQNCGKKRSIERPRQEKKEKSNHQG